MKSRTTPRARLLALATLMLTGCGVSELYVGFLQVDGGATSSTTTSATGGAGGATICTPGTTRSCYDGPAGTEGQGICKAGAQTCAADGASWGPCVGEVLPQPEDCATPQDEDCDGNTPACTGAVLWAKRFGGAGDQYVTSVAVDAADNVIVTGYFSGTIDFGTGPLVSAGGTDVFVAKLDQNGGPLWSKRFGDAADQYVNRVAVDAAGNVILSGNFAGTIDFGGTGLTSAGGTDVFVAKLEKNGGHLWSKRFGDAGGQAGTGAAVDSAGNIIITGTLAGTIDFGGGSLPSAGGADIFVAKLDQNGNHVWSKRFGDVSDQHATAVAVDATGNALITGYFEGSVDFGGGALPSAGGADIFVAKLDPNGSHLWSRRFGDANVQIVWDAAADTGGNVLLTGHFDGTVDFGGVPLVSAGFADVYVAKLDANGGHLWSRRFGDANDQVGRGVTADSAGSVLVVGDFGGSADFGGGPLASAGGRDVFLAKLDASGGHVWSKRFGDAQIQNGSAVASDSARNVLLVGSFAGVVDFGGGPLASVDGNDIFVAKLGP